MMNPDLLRRSSAALLLAVTAPLVAQGASSKPALGRGSTEALAARYAAAEHWVQKVVVLLSLNGYWHPVGADMLVAAMRERDPRLRAFGLEALLRSDEALLPKVATQALFDELVQRQLGASNKHYRARVEAALALLLPDAGVEGRSGWSRWWRANRETHQPAEWQQKEQPDLAAGGTAAAATRAYSARLCCGAVCRKSSAAATWLISPSERSAGGSLGMVRTG